MSPIQPDCWRHKAYCRRHWANQLPPPLLVAGRSIDRTLRRSLQSRIEVLWWRDAELDFTHSSSWASQLTWDRVSADIFPNAAFADASAFSSFSRSGATAPPRARPWRVVSMFSASSRYISEKAERVERLWRHNHHRVAASEVASVARTWIGLDRKALFFCAAHVPRTYISDDWPLQGCYVTNQTKGTCRQGCKLGLGKTVKIWPYSEVVWSQIFCLVFEYFWKFDLIWMWYHIPEFKTRKISPCVLSQARFPSWQLKLPSLTFKPREWRWLTTHNNHCCVIDWSIFY